jgi:hypothetical protein
VRANGLEKQIILLWSTSAAPASPSVKHADATLQPRRRGLRSQGARHASDTHRAKFVTLYHRALAAAIAMSIRMVGLGHLYGANANFIDAAKLDHFIHEMVK